MTYDIMDSILSKNGRTYESIDKGVWLFGAGIFGERMLCFLNSNDINALGFVDNNPQKINTQLRGKTIYSFEDFKKLYSNELILLCVLRKSNEDQIIDQIIRNISFVDRSFIIKYDAFMDSLVSEYCWKKQGRMVARVVQISLTERCTLKCKKCAHACNLVDMNATDLEVEDIISGIDVFFDIVDYIEEFVLLGGEPLLYKNLAHVVGHIGKHYRNRIGVFSITTNGTIVPNEQLLEVCEENLVKFRISDYSNTIERLKKPYEKLAATLNQYDIDYEFEKVEWVDFGFELVDRGTDSEILKRVFENCKTPCRELRYDRLYYCMMGRSISENMGYGIGLDDYLDLKNIRNSETRGKYEFLRYTLGFLDKGYIEMCQHCRGKEAYQYPLVPAEQM
ncbi:MAG: 4Fe-4S cluster-binding domain-containing protein [Lachnospiraceae bacterium]|nr:4Fe-4S cluster-binding domain-containing protein [Lachnospiraceae bacterium]